MLKEIYRNIASSEEDNDKNSGDRVVFSIVSEQANSGHGKSNLPSALQRQEKEELKEEKDTASPDTMLAEEPLPSEENTSAKQEPEKSEPESTTSSRNNKAKTPRSSTLVRYSRSTRSSHSAVCFRERSGRINTPISYSWAGSKASGD